MDRILLRTQDGSATIMDTRTRQTYHSVYGAITESKHVFIGEGFNVFATQHERLNILEIGLGTGLNALLTLVAAEQQQKSVRYTATEPLPLDENDIAALNYCELLHRTDLQHVFLRVHSCAWDTDIEICPFFVLHKMRGPLQLLSPERSQHLIYFDAFSPDAQPEMWTQQIFAQLYQVLLPGGMLVTYSSKGAVRRNMEEVGFIVTKKPGPPGKREMITARK